MSAVQATATFTLTAQNLSRGISDDFWDLLDPAHMDAWHDARDLLSKRAFHHTDCDIEISIDLSPGIRRLKKTHHSVRRILEQREPYAAGMFPRSDVKIPIISRLTRDNSNFANQNLAQIYIEEMIYDIFLIMNIAAPGSFDLYDASLSRPGRDKFMKHDFRLSNWCFESAMLASLEGKSSNVGLMRVSEVADWFFRIRKSASQIPGNPAEKCLFALLHLAKGDTDQLSIIWIFYALEALFSTKPAENLRFLNSRINLLLGLTDKESKSLKRHLRDLYDTRSSFVHGGMEILGISRNEILDKTVDDKIIRYMNLCDQGVSIILACLQALIRTGRDYPQFIERLV